MNQLAERMNAIAISPTIAITQKARSLKAAGRDVIALSAGEPDFPTPEHICEAAIAAIRNGETGYTNVDGTPALKAAIARKFERDNSLRYDADEIIATSGAKFLIFLAMLATLDAGDEVLIPTPYWVSYPDIVRLAGARPIAVDTRVEDDFAPSAESLAAMISPRTRWLFLNSPGNPSGAVMSATQLSAIAEVVRANPHIMVMTDDIYEHITFDDSFATLPAVAPDLKDRTLVVNGASKAYSMTGWRLGYGAGPAWLIGAMKKLAGQSTSNPCSITQAAGIAALDGPHDFLADRKRAFKRRRDLVVAALGRMEGVHCREPKGAFYAFPDIGALLGKRFGERSIETDAQFCEALLEEEALALVPGTAFGRPGHVRLSYATGEGELTDALDRMSRFISRLQ
jgi:aspartate aminotransferase